MAEGGGQLTITAGAEFMELFKETAYRNLARGHYLAITIEDTGHGIKPKILQNIFDPYFTTKDFGKGSGLGLAIVHGIVHSHNGAISVSSSADIGSSFTVYLPLHQTLQNETQLAVPEIAGGTEKIMFVDDDESLLT